MISSSSTAGSPPDAAFVDSVLERWRGATSQRAPASDQGFAEKPAPRPVQRTADAPLLQPSLGLDPDRFSVLKKPLR